MIFASSRFNYKHESIQQINQINQIDLVPTLCELLGLAVPLNNLGVLIEQVYSTAYNNNEKLLLEAIRRNYEQIGNLFGVEKETLQFDDFPLRLKIDKYFEASCLQYKFQMIICGLDGMENV